MDHKRPLWRCNYGKSRNNYKKGHSEFRIVKEEYDFEDNNG